MNYFNLFDLPEKFKIDYKQLSRKLHQLQKKYHPDLSLTLSKNIQRIHLKKSVLINNVYSLLKNPLERGKYLLSLHGININNQDYLIYIDDAFLNEQFDLNSKLEKMQKKNVNYKRLILFLKNLKKIEKVIFARLEHYFYVENWNKAKINLIKLMFFKQIINKTDKIIEIKMNLNESKVN